MDPVLLPIDLTAILGILLGMMVVLIPIGGLTARFAFKPIVEAIARMRETQGTNRETALLEKRVALLEQQIQGMESSMGRLTEEAEFNRKLSAPQDLSFSADPARPSG